MFKKDTRFTDLTVEEYCHNLDCWLREFKHMNLARWKLVQNTLISVLVALLALEAGADPTAAVGVIAIINGLSLADLATIFGGGAPPMDQQQSRQQDDDSETAKKKKQQ